MNYTKEQLEAMIDGDGDLILSNKNITQLPDNLTVGGSLSLDGCTSLTQLPDNLTVGGSLHRFNVKHFEKFSMFMPN